MLNMNPSGCLADCTVNKRLQLMNEGHADASYREKRKPNYGIMLPLVYAPLLPLSKSSSKLTPSVASPYMRSALSCTDQPMLSADAAWVVNLQSE